MNDDLLGTLRDVVEHLEKSSIEYMVFGSVAALVHGRARTTHDMDIVIEATGRQIRAFIEALPSNRFYASEEAAREALQQGTLFNVLDMETGWKVDLIPCKGRQFSQAELARRRRVELRGIEIVVASVEDVILSKLEWARMSESERQIEDASELVKLHRDRLDIAWIERWLDDLRVRELWERIATELARPSG